MMVSKAIGFIGLGNMGFWMATNLAEKVPVNSKIHVFDIVPALVDDICRKYPDRVVGCSSPEEVADRSVGILESVLFRYFLKRRN